MRASERRYMIPALLMPSQQNLTPTLCGAEARTLGGFVSRRRGRD